MSRETTGTDTKKDIEILNRSLGGEYFGITAYQAAMGTGLLEDGVRAVAAKFQGDHKQHAKSIEEAIVRSWGRPDQNEDLGRVRFRVSSASAEEPGRRAPLCCLSREERGHCLRRIGRQVFVPEIGPVGGQHRRSGSHALVGSPGSTGRESGPRQLLFPLPPSEGEASRSNSERRIVVIGVVHDQDRRGRGDHLESDSINDSPW